MRKGSGFPYIAHLLSVSSRLLSVGATEVQAVAGLLHDAAEDQDGQATLHEIRTIFGTEVSLKSCPIALTKPPWRPRKEACLASLPKKAPTSLPVSLADKLDNAEAILNDYRNIGDGLWDCFTGGIFNELAGRRSPRAAQEPLKTQRP